MTEEMEYKDKTNRTEKCRYHPGKDRGKEKLSGDEGWNELREYQRKGGFVSGVEAIMGGWWLGPWWLGPDEEDMGLSQARSSTTSPCSHWGQQEEGGVDEEEEEVGGQDEEQQEERCGEGRV